MCICVKAEYIVYVMLQCIVLCLLGVSETTAFNQLAARVLQPPRWCTRCPAPCSKLLSKWLSPAELGRTPLRGGEWCLDTPLPPVFRHGQCRLNDGV